MPLNAVISAVQGIGGGGILNLVSIIMSDLIPLAERGMYQGIVGAVYSMANGIGPPVVRTILCHCGTP